MIAAPARRNRDHRAAGRGQLITSTVVDADLGNAVFNKIYAFNIGLFFGHRRAVASRRSRSSWAPGGRLYVFHQTPGSGKNPPVERRSRALPAHHGFQVTAGSTAATSPAESLCLIAHR